ncbi:MAG: cyclodeaminase/cyclohydrolase family protein [Phycisphaerales bacterium]|jgi:formiminotetrahydrofolate cyclodeaminase
MANSPSTATETGNARIGSQSVGDLLSAIAEKTPAPGGGAVVGAVGALSAALAGMVIAYSRDKKSLTRHAPAHAVVGDRCAAASCKLLELADADAAAYAELNALQRLDPDDPERIEKLGAAAKRCIDIPLDVQRICLSLLEGFEELAPIANEYLLSDLKIAAILAEAAVRASDCNIEVNAPTLGSAVSPEAERDAQATSLQAIERAKNLLRSVEALIDD